MKIRHAATGVAVIAAAIFGLLGGSASATNKPIPGVDIIVKKTPGGRAITVTTDEDGKFVFANLETGTYQLTVNMPQTKSIINTSRSNIKHPSLRIENGVEVFDVSIELGQKQPAAVEIKFTKKGGKIVGTVTRAENDGDGKRSSQTDPVNGGVAKPTPTPKPPSDPGNVGIGSSLAKPNPKGKDGSTPSRPINVVTTAVPFKTAEQSPNTSASDKSPGLAKDPGPMIRMAILPKEGSAILYKEHKGIVNLEKGRATLVWEDGNITLILRNSGQLGTESGISDQAAGGSLTSYRTMEPKKGSDGILRYQLVRVPDSKTLPNGETTRTPGLQSKGGSDRPSGYPAAVIRMANPPGPGSLVLYKRHKGIVTLEKGETKINWEDGGYVTRILLGDYQDVNPNSAGSGSPGISDQAAGGSLTSYRTASPKKGKDGTITFELEEVSFRSAPK